ncbi:MAG: hypothetical protein RIB98_15825 [Acidimicrobiales bacterium]
MTGAPVAFGSREGGMDRRSFVGRTVAVGAAVWAAPSVISMEPVAAAVGSCAGVSVHEFSSGLDGWTIDNEWGDGVNGLWNHNVDAGRDGGSLHYGRGVGGTYRTGSSRNSGRVYSPEFLMPATGPFVLKFTLWRQVETVKNGSDRLTLRILGPPNASLYSVSSVGDTSGFENHTITLPNGVKGRTIRLQFEFDTRDGKNNDHEGIYIGRFELNACPPPGGG